MTYLVPNYFLEDQPHNVISSDSVFTLTYSSRKNQSNFMIRNTTHVMILLMEGSKRITYKENSFLLEEGSILLLSQGNYMMSEIISEDGKYEALMVYFDDAFVIDFCKKYDVNLELCEEESFVAFSSDKLLKSLMDSFELYINKELKNKNEILKLKTQELFLHLLSEEKNNFETFLKSIVNSSTHRVIHVLEANIDIIQSVEDMCSIARVSKNELRKEIEKYFSMSPKSWLDSKRLEQASFLLKTSDESIASIATTCGYSTLSWFGVQFKKFYGLTPKVYREQNQ